MNIASINGTQNFNGIRKVIEKTEKGVLTRLISPKGKEVGFSFVSNSGEIAGSRIYPDGVEFSYQTHNLPIFNDVESYVVLVVNALNKLKKAPEVFSAKYQISAKFAKENPKLFTRKGIENFVVQTKSLKSKPITDKLL